jgi:Mn-dependent DtxR family transcriptional regulator
LVVCEKIKFTKIITALKSTGKPMKAAEIAEQIGVDKKEVDKAIKELKKQGTIESPKACYYGIKE